MYKFFLECFQKYLSLYSAEFAADEHLLTLLGPLYGLTNGSTYENWKLSSDLRYYEASNLVYRMLHDEGLPAELRELGGALLVNGCDAILAGPGTFAEETVQGQLKLIYAMLTRDPMLETTEDEAEPEAEPELETAAEEEVPQISDDPEDDAIELDMEGNNS